MSIAQIKKTVQSNQITFWLILLTVLILGCNRAPNSNHIRFDIPEDGAAAGFTDDNGDSILAAKAIYDGMLYCVLLSPGKNAGEPSLYSIRRKQGIITTKIAGNPVKLPGPGIYFASRKSEQWTLTRLETLDGYPERLKKWIAGQDDAANANLR